ncbi:MAG: Organic solvent tolerance protein OstA-like protein [Ignavibacteria bacterium]|nr:MAG: Organic solvent tolerance protein OstA-like protein [Ignavibacteria bacterium]KAF0160663.1 MAG: Organic solvent tolerance protein OstA-like protein [Ignavibacteria bacterium]
MKKFNINITVIFFFFTSALFSQQKESAVNIFSPDSLKAAQKDSVAVSDSLKQKKQTDIDAVINAAASDSLIFQVKKKKMFMYGSGELKYKSTDLKSAKIFIDYEKNELEAFGAEDTSDTAKVKIKGTPSLTEGRETFEGSYIRHNFKTQKGFISLAKNKEKDQRYEGEKVKKVDKSTFFIEDGMFTSCESDTPHTHFTASQMKVLQKDKIIAKWIFMNIGGVPLPIPIPFAVIPNETGRRSGIIVPGYGQDGRRGQYFHNFGYFWAISDYFDAALTGDYYTKGGWGARSRFRYAKRYNFNGSFDAGYSKISIGDANDPDSKRSEQNDWRLSWNHFQSIDPTAQLSANLQFVSSNYLSNNSIDYNTLLSQQIYSAASFSKSWENSSISMNYSRTQYLNNGDIDEAFPNVSYSQNIFYPFRKENSASEAKQKWYELIGISYSGQFSNSNTKKGNVKTSKLGALHNLSLNFSPKVGYVNVSPNFSYQEKWYNKRIKMEPAKYDYTYLSTGKSESRDTVIERSIKELNFVRTFSMGVSASTKIYGLMNPNLMGVESFRHTLMPSISYNYEPDFSDDVWGYWDSFTDAKGNVVRYDKFRSGIFGGAGNTRSQSINFSAGNVFEIKMAKTPGDTTKEQKKIQLLNFDASVGYNFAADSMKLRDLSLSYRTQIGDLLNLSGSSSYTFYDQIVEKGINGQETYRYVNQYLASNGKGLLRLTNLNFSISSTLSGERLKSDDQKTEKNPEANDDLVAIKKKDFIALYDDSQAPDLAIPWNLSLSYNFNYSKPNPKQSDVFSNLSADLGFSLTKNWKFTLRGSYDFQEKKISAPQITVYRDLHCWEMNFTWNPLGTYNGFRFEIRMKAPELQDIKVTKAGGLYSGRR